MIKEVIRSSQMMAFEECCKNERKKDWERANSPYKAGIARRLRMKKRRKAGKKATKW